MLYFGFLPGRGQTCHARCHWHHRLSSRISGSSRIDLGIYYSTLSQQKTWVFPVHSREECPTSSTSPSSRFTPTHPLRRRVKTHKLGLQYSWPTGPWDTWSTGSHARRATWQKVRLRASVCIDVGLRSWEKLQAFGTRGIGRWHPSQLKVRQSSYKCHVGQSKLENEIFEHLRRDRPRRDQEWECHLDLCQHWPSAGRCADEADLGKRQWQDLPALGLDAQKLTREISRERSKIHSRNATEFFTKNCRTVSAIEARMNSMNAILMYIAAVQTTCLGCLSCRVVLVGWFSLWPRVGIWRIDSSHMPRRHLELENENCRVTTLEMQIAELQLCDAKVAVMQLRMPKRHWYCYIKVAELQLWRAEVNPRVGIPHLATATAKMLEGIASTSRIKSYHRKVRWRDWSPLLDAQMEVA